MNPKISNVTKWFASADAVSFTLFVGVCFLFTNYQGVIFGVNPENAKEVFTYPYFLRVIIAHLDSFFFAFATVVIIFQSKNEWQKGLYCFFEVTMLCLNLTKKYHEGNDYYIAIYVGVFSGFTLYFLGKLAKEHLSIETKDMQIIADLEAQLQAQSETHKKSIGEASELHSKEMQSIAQTLQETKDAMQTLQKQHSNLQDAMQNESEAKELAMQQNTVLQSELQAFKETVWQWEVSHLKLAITSCKKANNWRQDAKKIATLENSAKRLYEVISERLTITPHNSELAKDLQDVKELQNELQNLTAQQSNGDVETN